MSCVYILRGRNNRYYIGSSNNFSRRIEEHKSGKSKYTREILPIEVVFLQEYDSLSLARKVEFWLKKQKSSKIIDQIIKDGVIKKNWGLE